MKISTENLKKCLSRIVAPRKVSLPILSSVKIEAANNRFKISATDLDCWSVSETECDGSLDPICVSGNTFRRLVESANGNATLTLEKNNRLNFNSGYKSQIGGLAAEEFPMLPSDKAKAIGVNCEELADGIEAVYWAAHPNKLEALHLVAVKLTGKAIVCYAGDRKTGSRYLHPAITPELNFEFPPEFSKPLINALRCEKAVLSMTDKHILVSHDSGCFIVRLSDMKFPDFHKLLSECKFTPIGEVPIAELQAAAEQAFNLNDSSRNIIPILVTFSKDGIHVECTERENHFNSTVKGKFKPHACRVDSHYLATILKNSHCESMLTSHAKNGILAFESGDLLVAVQTLTNPPTKTTKG